MNKMNNHQAIVNAVTQFDIKESKKKFYNRYALAQYLKAVQDIEKHVANGVELRMAVIGCFNGRLADTVLKALGLTLMTDSECRYGVNLPNLPEDDD